MIRYWSEVYPWQGSLDRMTHVGPRSPQLANWQWSSGRIAAKWQSSRCIVVKPRSWWIVAMMSFWMVIWCGGHWMAFWVFCVWTTDEYCARFPMIMLGIGVMFGHIWSGLLWHSSHFWRPDTCPQFACLRILWSNLWLDIFSYCLDVKILKHWLKTAKKGKMSSYCFFQVVDFAEL